MIPMRTVWFAACFVVLAVGAAPPSRAAELSALSSDPVPIQREHIKTALFGDRGPVIVLIPGMSTPGAVWTDAVADLSPDNRVLVVDIRGFDGERGTSNENEGLIPGVVANLSADLAERHLTSAVVAGHSFGGLLALQFALEHPDQTSAVLVVDALPFFGTVFDADATLTSTAPMAEQMRTMMTNGAEAMRHAATQEVTSGAGAAGMSLQEDDRIKIARWSLSAEPLVVGQALYEDLRLDLREAIGGLEGPVTVLYQAEQDPVAAQARYQADYAALSQVRLVPVSETAHFIMLDRPDLFHQELRALIARVRTSE